MPQILVVTDPEQEQESAVVYRERVASSDLESPHFSGQLVERVGWAVRDAVEIERTDPRVTRMRRKP
ncbi:MAG: hypothetical protein ABW065_13970 [Solirubrobacterales bacterium]